MRLLVLDVDGVMTNGRLEYDADGEHGKSFHVRDGYGIKAVISSGIDVAVISGRESQLLSTLKLQLAQCICVGDDEPDVPMLQLAGLAVAVADAHPVATAVAHRRTRQRGGAGAVREVCDWLLAAQSPARASRRRR